ncbi:hypothetical protein ACOTWJ_09245 [Aliarcobacter butzleri]
MNSQIIFINENEDVFKVLDKENVEYSKKIVQHLRFIARKKSNNYIGYYQFKQNDLYYKIYILPKTSPKVSDDKTNVKNFINLLKLYYELKSKYKEIKVNEIFDNIIDFGFDIIDDRKNSDDIEDFINYKYFDALKVIEEFFKRHNRSINKEVDFMSQSIKNRLDLKRNIAELDKSKIHQIKKVPYLYSKIAIISIECINYFNTKDLNKTIKNRAKIINSKIKNKFKMKANFDFKLNQITSKKIKKLFKTKEQIKLYTALLQLIGVENYYNDSESKEIFKLYNQHSLFFRPEKLYEWFVYDRLVKSYSNYNILKDDYKNGTKKTYKINKLDIDSKPDILVIDNKRLFVIDVKWRILDKGKPAISDILKLKRDTEVRSFDAKEIFSLLVFPKSDNLLYNEYLINSKDESTFKFYSRQIGMSDEYIDILTDITEVSLVNGNLNKLNQLIFQTNKTDYTNNPEFIEQITEEISSYVTEYFSEDTIFGNYSIIRNFIDNEHDKSETMIRLLKSSVSVLFYLDNFVDEQYSDYTLPASSIWKAIESEIKENIRFFIKDIKKNNSREKLYNDSITLGTYSFVFRNIVNYKNLSDSRNTTYNTFKDILNVLDKTMEEYKSFFEIITDMRNDYTHNEIMTKENFYEYVLNGIFSTNICSAVTIEDILKFNIEMKKNLEIL